MAESRGSRTSAGVELSPPFFDISSDIERRASRARDRPGATARLERRDRHRGEEASSRS